MLKQILLLFSLTIFLLGTAQDKSTSRLFEILDYAKNHEEYKVGLNRIKELSSKLVKTEGDSSIHYAKLLGYEAYFNGVMNDFGSYKTALQQVEEILSNTAIATQLNDLHLILSEAYQLTGNFSKSIEHLSQCDSSFEVSLEKIQINIALGKLKESEKQLLSFNETSEGKIKASGILLLAKLYTNQKVGSATQLLNTHASLFLESLKKQRDLSSQYYFLLAQDATLLEQYKTAEKYYGKAFLIGSKYFESHSLFLNDVFKCRYHNFFLMDKPSEAEYHENLQDVKMLGYYGKRSIPFLMHNLTSIKRKADYGDYSGAYVELKPYTKIQSVFPAEYIQRLDVAEALLPVFIGHKNFVGADSTLGNALVQALNIYGKESPKYHEWLLKKASFLGQYSNDFEEALIIYAKSLSVLKKHYGNSNRVYSAYLKDYVNLLIDLEKFDEAKSLLTAQTVSESIRLNTLLGKPEQAKALLEIAYMNLSKANGVATNIKRSQLLRLEANVHLLEGDYFKADSLFTLADKTVQNSYYHQQFCSITEKGSLIHNDFKITKNKRLLQKEIQTVESFAGANNFRLIPSLNLLAQLNIQEGDYTQAEKNIARVERIIDTLLGKESIMYSDLLYTKQKLYENLGDYERAEKNSYSRMELLESRLGKEHIRTALAYGESALSKGFLSSPDTAICNQLFKQALSVIKTQLGDDKILYAKVLKNRGLYFLLLEQLTDAQKDIEKAKDIWEQQYGNKNLQKTELEFLLGQIEFKLNHYEKALIHFSTTEVNFKSIFNDEHPQFINALGFKSRALYSLNKKKEAIQTANEVVEKSLNYLKDIFPNLSEREKANYWNKVKEHFEFYSTLAFTSADEYPNMIGKVFDITLQTKAILLNASVKLKNEILNSNNNELTDTYYDWLELKETLIQAISMSTDSRKENGLNVDEIETKIEGIEKYLGQETTSFSKKNSTTYKWQQLKEVLNDQDHIIETVAFRVFDKGFTDSIWYVALEVNSSTKSNPAYAVFKNGNYMHGKGIMYYRQCMKYNLDDDQSYHAFWEPIDSLITKKGNVFISYEGIYNRLNPETFITPEKDYLINKYNIIPIGSSRDLIDNNNKTVEALSNTAEFIGNPDFYSSGYDGRKRWSQLPGTEKEVVYLHDYLSDNKWNSTMVKDSSATEGYVKSISNPDILHIATHGFYVEKSSSSKAESLAGKIANNPLLRSGVMFCNGGEIHDNSPVYEFNKQDGILTAYEAMSLQLDNTNLVVLSACETGLGEIELGEGVFGLQRSFTVAGAKTIIISLFTVSDEVTTELMKKFYQYWLETKSKQEAFIKAKKEIMVTYKKPNLWGAFIMISSSTDD